MRRPGIALHRATRRRSNEQGEVRGLALASPRMAARSAPPVEVRLATPTSPVPLRKLGIRGRMPVLAVAGTTTELEPALAKALLPALRAAVAAAASEGAAIVTGGTDAGVLHVLGLALGIVVGDAQGRRRRRARRVADGRRPAGPRGEPRAPRARRRGPAPAPSPRAGWVGPGRVGRGRHVDDAHNGPSRSEPGTGRVRRSGSRRSPADGAPARPGHQLGRRDAGPLAGRRRHRRRPTCRRAPRRRGRRQPRRARRAPPPRPARRGAGRVGSAGRRGGRRHARPGTTPIWRRCLPAARSTS